MYLRNRLTIPIKGYNRSIIYDLTRKDYHFIPNSVYKNLYSSNLIEIKEEEAKSFLEFEEIIFKASIEDLKLFPELTIKYKTPYHIVSLIIHSDSLLGYNGQMQGINVESISIIFNNLKEGFKVSKDVEKLLLDVDADSIDIYLTDSDLSWSDQNLNFLKDKKEIFNLFVFATSEEHQDVKDFLRKCLVELNRIDTDYRSYTTDVYPSKFAVNKDLFIESKNRNAYYNKKIYIDQKGNISNGMFTEKVLIFSKLNSFDEILNNILLTSRWTIVKDEIPICKNCEFRNMCIDSRELKYSKLNDIWFYKNECRYNPFISKWEGEEGYLSLEDCNIQFHQGLLTYDKEDLSSIFNKVWLDE
ncbi:MAG: hypothetical protein V3U92_14860 [Cellulophaga sp.]